MNKLLISLLFIFHTSSVANAQYSSNELNAKLKGIPCLNGSLLPFHLYSKPKTYFQTRSSSSNTNLSDEMICGRFKIYFQDITMHTGYGFDDTRGPDRRNTLCDVLNYIQSVIYIPPGDGSYIEIIVLESGYISAQPTISSSLSLAGVFESSDFANGVDGFYNGNAYDHLTTGIDPDTSFYDGLLAYNFMRYEFAEENYNPVTYFNYCTYDLYTLMLHDMTHVLGFRSFIEEESASHLPRSFRHPFKQYTLMDKRSLFQGDVVSGNFTQVIDSNTFNIQTGAWSIHNDSLWLNDTRAPFNFGLYAPGPYGSSLGYSPGHLNDWDFAFAYQGFVSPGFEPTIVMHPFFYEGELETSKTYTKFELQFLEKLGYQFNSSFLTDTTLSGNYINSIVLGNSYPFTTKKCIESPYKPGYYPDSAFVDFRTDNCHSVVIDLNRDSTLHDPDGDSIRIYPGSLFNIRGCGFHGNNHDRLTISPDGKIITFYPRDNFIGRAQFGFDLYDGKERGMFVVYTIDVTRNDTCFNSNGNLVVNGDFEEGSEVRTYFNRQVENGIFINNHRGKYVLGYNFFDGEIYTVGGIIRSASMWCRNADATFTGIPFGPDWYSFDYPFPWAGGNVHNPLPVNNIGDRYNRYAVNHLLNEPLYECTKYRITFDINFDTFYSPNLTGFEDLHILFSNENNQYWPDNTVLDEITIPLNFLVPSGWIHVDTTFIYCNSDSSNFFSVVTNAPYYEYFIDNMSITKEPFAYKVLAGNDRYFCEGNQFSLNAELNDQKCPATFHWSPTDELSCSDCPVTVATPTKEQQIIVSATVGNCPVQPDTINLLFQTPPPALNLGNDTSFCVGNSVVLFNYTPSYPVTWFNGFNMDSLSISSTGNFWASVYDGCRHNFDTVHVSAYSPASVDLGKDTMICPGTSLLLKGPVADTYLWITGETTSSIFVNQPALYSIIVNKNNCFSYDSIFVDVYQFRPDTITGNLFTCKESPVILHVPEYALDVSWNTGEQTDSIQVNSAGNYIATFKDSICLTDKNFNVNFYPEVNFEIEQKEDTLYSSIDIPGFEYYWTLNNVLVQASSKPYLFPVQPGNYTLQVKDQFGCLSVSQSFEVNTPAIHIYYNYGSQLIVIRATWNGMMKVYITDVLGQTILRKELNENINTVPVNLQALNLSSAYYFISLESNNIHSVFKLPVFSDY